MLALTISVNFYILFLKKINPINPSIKQNLRAMYFTFPRQHEYISMETRLSSNGESYLENVRLPERRKEKHFGHIVVHKPLPPNRIESGQVESVGKNICFQA